MTDALLLIVALVVILAGAELFTNGIEWFGRKLNLAEGAVGSVLAAVGTALPETMIPIIAILFSAQGGGEGSHDTSHAVGVGAILGAPFMLATLAMFVTGLGVVLYGRRRATGGVMQVDAKVLGKDVRYFFVTYGLAVGAALLPAQFSVAKLGVAGLLIVLYALYVKAHFEAASTSHADELAPLRFHRFDRAGRRADPTTPRLRAVNLQVLAALGLILVGAVFFVDAVEHLAEQFAVDPALLSLVIAPIATELPEKFNSILWVRQGKDTLAMGNITGAMVFQSCIPTFVALVFAGDAWSIFDPGTGAVTTESLVTFASAGMAFIASAIIFVPMMRSGTLHGRRLLIGGVLYLLYLALVLASVMGVI